MKKRWNAKTYKFQLFTFTFVTVLLLLNFLILGFYNVFGIYSRASIPNRDNIAWMFTQFTWWTTTLFWLVLTLRFFCLRRFLDNKYVNFFYKEGITLLLAAYLTIVSILYWLGVILIFAKKEHYFSPKGNSFNFDSIPLLHASDLIITIMVHTIVPILCIKMFLMYNRQSLKKRVKYSYIKTLLIGMIYPIIYTIFYITFALSPEGYDPYNITILKNGIKVWTIPIVLSSFIFSILFYTYVSNEHSKRFVFKKINKMFHKKKTRFTRKLKRKTLKWFS